MISVPSASTSSSGIWDTQLQGKDASWEIESIKDCYILCLYSLKEMRYALNPDLMAVEIEPITVQAVICLYKLIRFIFF